MDYDAVVTHSGGRRVNRADPAKSLLLAKPTFAVPHGGGQRMAADSLESQALLQWIKEGAPKGKATPVRLTSLRVFPEDLRVLDSAGVKQQLLVIGNYSDGSHSDLTRTVQYTPSDEGVVEVSASGLVTPKQNGEAIILVRSLGQVASTRVAVALRPKPVQRISISRRNFIDEHISAKLELLRIEPSGPATDAQFLRRVYLDLIGTLPTRSEVEEFLADGTDGKRDRLVDRLLQRPEYADFWAQKWGDLFMMAPLYVHDNSLHSHEYFRVNFATDKPYNQVAREMITGLGSMAEIGPNNFYTRENRRIIEEYSTFVSQTFLGVSLECARCHDHPREKWTRNDFLGVAAFFSQVKIKEGVSYRPFEGLVTLNYNAEFKHPQTLQVVRPRLLDGSEPPIRPMVDRRQILADWVVSPDNPFFAKATVNRVWRQVMGRGLVEPVDDFRATNPPTHPELLNRLAAYFVDAGFRLKPLIALILKSGVYQLGAGTNDSNAGDHVNYSHYYIRRLTAEQLLDAVSQVTGVPEKFPGFYRGKRAIELPDSGVNSYFLDTFDRPIRDVAKCERKTTTTVTQAMHSLSGETITEKLRAPEGSVARHLAARAAPDEIVRAYYLSALSRLPDDAELAAARAFIGKAGNVRNGVEGFVWALLNSKEFLFNH
jgi:hypothetical protein